MPGPRYTELLSLRLVCSDEKCGQSFQKVIAQLAERNAIPCPRCSKPVDLSLHKTALERLVALAAELEKQPPP